MIQINLSSSRHQEQARIATRGQTSVPSIAEDALSALSYFCLLTFAFCLLPCSFSRAAERPHLITRWENFTTANGMPDAKVFCVAVDGQRVWAGTEDGLVLIENGKVAKVYRPADGLAHRAVMGIAVDKSNGDLWIATFGGVSHFSGGRFENFTNLTSGLLNDICYGIAVVDQYVWVATTAGVSRYNTLTTASGPVGARRTRRSTNPGPTASPPPETRCISPSGAAACWSTTCRTTTGSPTPIPTRKWKSYCSRTRDSSTS